MEQFDLQAKACLVYVVVRNPSFQKTSGKLSQDTAAHHGADEDRLTSVVAMIPKRYLQGLKNKAQQIRRCLEVLSSPWATRGVRIMPVGNIDKVKAAVDAAIAEFLDEVEAFVKKYSSIRQQAKQGLGNLGEYVEEHWPSPERIREKFSARIGFAPVVAVGEDFRLQLSKEQAEAMRHSMRDEMETSMAEAMQDNKDRAMFVLSEMVRKVSAYKVTPDPKAAAGYRTEGSFWATAMTNVKDVASAVRDLNLIDDKGFDQICKRMEALGDIDATHLKIDPVLRKEALTEAQSLMKALGM